MIDSLPRDGEKIVMSEKATFQFYRFLQQTQDLLNKLDPIEFTGNPNGSIKANKGQYGLDTSGPVLYFKTTSGSDTGWIALN